MSSKHRQPANISKNINKGIKRRLNCYLHYAWIHRPLDKMKTRLPHILILMKIIKRHNSQLKHEKRAVSI